MNKRWVLLGVVAVLTACGPSSATLIGTTSQDGGDGATQADASKDGDALDSGGWPDAAPDTDADPADTAPKPTCAAPTAESDLAGVAISTTQSTPCVVTLAQAAAGVTLPYAIVIEAAVADVVVVPGDAGWCAKPGPGGLIVFEKLDGGGQSYCICDTGLCMPPSDKPVTLQPGTYLGQFEWDGRNWGGPSDTNNPKGAAFPAGQYTLHLTATGTVAGKKFKVAAGLPVTLVP